MRSTVDAAATRYAHIPWFTNDDLQLSQTARTLIEDGSNDILLSLASVWEIAIKTSIGKLTIAEPLDQSIPHELAANRIALLHIELDHVLTVRTLPKHHRDPFDRLLVAQRISENLGIVGVDGVLNRYGVTRYWQR